MTVAKSLNWFLARRDRSRERNLRTACILDSPRGLESRFLGRGTTNLPSLFKVWVSSKWRMTVRSWGDRLDAALGLSSISQNCLKMSSPEVTVTWWVDTWLWRTCSLSVLPASTQPKMVSNATGESAGPCRRPCNSEYAQTSTPNKMSILPGHPNSESESSRPDKWFHFELKPTGCAGISQVTLGTTTAVTGILSSGENVGETWNVEIECNGELWEIPAIPVIWRFFDDFGSPSDCTNRWDTNEVVEPESSRPRALIWEPSGAWISTWQVIMRVLELVPVCALVETMLAVHECSFSGVSGVSEGVWSNTLVSMCNKVWWGFWHCLQRWRLGQFLAMCPGLKQFRHRLLERTVDNILSWGKLLNFGQAYSGCFSTLQVTQFPADSKTFPVWAEILWGLV